jgi:hypothetical protein
MTVTGAVYVLKETTSSSMALCYAMIHMLVVFSLFLFFDVDEIFRRHYYYPQPSVCGWKPCGPGYSYFCEYL